MAKKNALFAGSWRQVFFIANGPHLKNSGGLLHRQGSSSAILDILPFWQTGQTLTSIPQILSNCSCQVSGLLSSFAMVLPTPRILRHTAMALFRFLFASKPKWRILT
jgi:hypothetical protein